MLLHQLVGRFPHPRRKEPSRRRRAGQCEASKRLSGWLQNRQSAWRALNRSEPTRDASRALCPATGKPRRSVRIPLGRNRSVSTGSSTPSSAASTSSLAPSHRRAASKTADFLGSPPMNLLDATLDGDRLNWPASECRCRSGSTGSEARSSSGSVRRIGFAEDGIPATANWPNCSVTHDHRPQGRREAPEGAADAEPPLRRRRDGTIGRRLAPRALLTRPAPVSISPAAGSHATAP